MKKYITSFFLIFFFCFPFVVIASQKEDLRLDYNKALLFVQKRNYPEALAILEAILTNSNISNSKKSSFAKIELLSLFTFARIYNELAFIALQAEEKNYEVPFQYLQRAIKIYQQILNNPFSLGEKFQEIHTASVNNLEYSKILLFQNQEEQKKEKANLLEQKDIPTFIQELKKAIQKTISDIDELEIALVNYKTLEQKNELLKKQLNLNEEFVVLQKKILQKNFTESTKQ